MAIEIQTNAIKFNDNTTQTTAAGVVSINGQTGAVTGFVKIDVNTSSSATDYAIGTTILVDSNDSSITLNQSKTIYLDGPSYQKFEFDNKGYGSLNGTWRSRGYAYTGDIGIGENNDQRYPAVFQRTA